MTVLMPTAWVRGLMMLGPRRGKRREEEDGFRFGLLGLVFWGW